LGKSSYGGIDYPFRIGAGIITYNDGPGLERCLNSIHQGVDRIFVIDGRYPDWGDDKVDDIFSNDGTYALCMEYPNLTYVALHADQNTKRTEYLRLCSPEEYDINFLIVIDADEFVIDASWKEFRNNIQRYIYDFPGRHSRYIYQIKYQFEPHKTGFLARLIQDPWQLKYIKHYILTTVDNIGDIPVPQSTQLIEGITIITDDSKRHISRMQRDINYQWDLFYKEHEFGYDKYHDPKEKEKFAKHIAYEKQIWDEHYEAQQDESSKPV
jgi:hypothetical protein